MSENRTRRHKAWRAIALLLGAIIVADTVVWAMACRRLDDGAREALQANGWLLGGAPSRWGGWPIAANVTLDDAVVRSGPDIVPPLTWTAKRLVLRLTAWAPTQLSIVADGAQTIAVGAARPVPFSAASLRAAIDLPGSAPPRVTAQGLAVDAPGFPVRIDTATIDLVPDGWSAALDGVAFPGTTGRPIDPVVASLRLAGQLTPPVRAFPTAEASAADWRDRGGKLDLRMTELRWGTLTASGQATITLDAALQPALTGNVAASGLPGALRQLAANGAITQSAATAAGAMLAILAAPSGTGPLDLPVTLTDGVLSVARFPLLRLPKLRWTNDAP